MEECWKFHIACLKSLGVIYIHVGQLHLIPFRFISCDDAADKLFLKEKLATVFEMKDLGKLKYFLGIQVAYSKVQIKDCILE